MNKDNVIKTTFPVLEMTCAACAVSVESMLKAVDGVYNASVNFANQDALVEYDATKVTPDTLRKTVQSIGYDLIIETDNQEDLKNEAQKKQYYKLKQRTIWASILSLPIVIIGMFFMDIPYANWIMMVLATPVVFYFGRSFFANAIKQARNKKANMDTLVALSTGIAYLFSLFNTLFPDFWHRRGLHAHVYFEAAAVVIAFISLGKLLEEKAKSNTSSAIKKLIGLQPKTVRVIVNNTEVEKTISEVLVGDIVQVRPGEKIAVDGKVTEGYSYVDESMISGESIPVEKKKNDKVFTGTINQKGSFRFVAEKIGSDTLLSQIIKMVQEAQGSKAPVQKIVDKIAGIFVPIVIGISVLTFIAWMLLGGDAAFTHALLTSVTVLVIACPCALGLATPTAIMVGIGKGAEMGILIKDAESLETGHKVNAVVLDKTGTITEGHPDVTNIIWKENVEKDSLSQILYTMEASSEHPLAEALVRYFQQHNVVKAEINSFESITGMGVSAISKGKKYYAGSSKMIAQNAVNIDSNLQKHAANWQEEAKTVIWFWDEVSALAVVAIADTVKKSSAIAIERLHNLGIEVYMLTGDNKQTAKAIAEQVGILHYNAETLPSDKAAFVKALQAQGKIVAMVGDGINDSHALAQADMSIAMGKGSDIAIDVAKMTLIQSDLNAIPTALNLSRKTVNTIKQNLFWAFIYNLIGVPIAAGLLYPINGFLLDPMIAGGAMALSSVSVVSNSLRLKLAKL
ncbi:copper-translocating P-type ATPase [Chitinophagaceae bacterium IBVUCB1]|nr:copper-translocating P-type ATPase [Chitinophagaceae bacterium IBVUCB1]